MQLKNINPDLITVNSLFAYWIKELNMTKYREDTQILPTNTPLGIYGYSDAILKHLSKDSLKAMEKTLLYSKKLVQYTRDFDRHLNNNAKANNRTSENIKKRLQKFTNTIRTNETYRIPLKYLCNIGK